MKRLKTECETRFCAFVLCTAVVFLFALSLTSSAVFAQQSTAIQPCAEPTPAHKTGVLPKAPSAAVKSAASETLVDDTIPGDPRLEKLVAPYSGKVRALETVIGRLEDELKKGPVGAGTLGNFVTDGLRAQASKQLGHPVQLMITNSGGLRKSAITPGQLRAADIFELLPFENALIQLDLSGDQLLKLLAVVLTGRDAQSGAKIWYRLGANKAPEFVSAKLLTPNGGEMEIDPRATYSVVTTDYLLGLASGNYSILQDGKNLKHLGLTMRDAMMDYVKGETAAGRPIRSIEDDRFVAIDAVKPEAPTK